MSARNTIRLFVLTAFFAGLETIACTSCKEHQAQPGQDSGSSAYLDDSAPKRGFAANKAVTPPKKVYRMKADGTVEITDEAPSKKLRNDVDGIQVKF